MSYMTNDQKLFKIILLALDLKIIHKNYKCKTFINNKFALKFEVTVIALENVSEFDFRYRTLNCMHLTSNKGHRI